MGRYTFLGGGFVIKEKNRTFAKIMCFIVYATRVRGVDFVLK